MAPPTTMTQVQSQTPSADTPAQSADENGYEWYTTQDGTNFYRTAASGSDWVKFVN